MTTSVCLRAVLIRFVLLLVVFVPGFIAAVSAAPTIDISVSGDITSWALIPGLSNSNINSVTMTVNASDPGWKVKVRDASDNGKPVSYSGRMVEYNSGTGYVSASPGVLGTNVSVMGYGGTGLTNSSVTLGPGDLEIETGSSGGIFGPVAIAITQFVDYSDVHLQNGNQYRIVITFTGGYS